MTPTIIEIEPETIPIPDTPDEIQWDDDNDDDTPNWDI